MSAPVVSVLLPVRDAAPTLGDCLESLARQTLREHEVVAVDDGSRDASRALLEAARARDPRVRVLDAGRRGLVAALNAGLAAARAPLLARLDADDIARPERLALQARRLREDARVDVLGCGVKLLGDPGRGNAGMRAYVDWLNSLHAHGPIVRDLLVESPLAHPSVMLWTAALRRLGGYREFDGPEDYDLWLRAHAAGLRFGKLREELLLWRDSAGRLTRTDARYRPDRFLALKLAHLERGPLAAGRELVVWGAGRVGKTWARALCARGHRLAAFVEVDPRKLGRRIHGAPVLDVAAAARLRGPLHLAAVGQPGARARIRAAARRARLREADLVAVA